LKSAKKRKKNGKKKGLKKKKENKGHYKCRGEIEGPHSTTLGKRGAEMRAIKEMRRLRKKGRGRAKG